MQYSPSNNVTYDFMAFTTASFPETPPVTKKYRPSTTNICIDPVTGHVQGPRQHLQVGHDAKALLAVSRRWRECCFLLLGFFQGHSYLFWLLTAYNPEQRVSFRKLCWRKTTCVFLCLFLDSYPLFCSMAYSPWLILYHVLWVQIQVELLPYLWQLILYFPVTYTFKNYKYVTNICLDFHQHRFFHINTQFFGKWKSSIPSKRIGSRSNFGPPFSA